MNKYIFISLIMLFALSSTAQSRINWDILADVTFISEYSEAFGSMQTIPRFGKDPQTYEGKEVTISGYTIPIDGTGTYFVLSKFPYANCYFCGGAGAETIIELSLKPEHQRRFKTDERVTIKGKLKLNDSDVYSLPYLLIEAEVIE